jgi:uncharacterized membrane protein
MRKKETKTVRTCMKLFKLQQTINAQESQKTREDQIVVTFEKFIMGEIINKAENPRHQILTDDITRYLKREDFLDEKGEMYEVVRSTVLETRKK